MVPNGCRIIPAILKIEHSRRKNVPKTHKRDINSHQSQSTHNTQTGLQPHRSYTSAAVTDADSSWRSHSGDPINMLIKLAYHHKREEHTSFHQYISF